LRPSRPTSPSLAQRKSALPQGQWSGGEQLFLRGKKAGDFVELEFPVSDPGPRKVALYGTQSYDYGILRFSINGKPAAKDSRRVQNVGRGNAPAILIVKPGRCPGLHASSRRTAG